MDKQTLCTENLAYADTNGISQNNRALNLRPAFLDKSTGRIEIAKLKDGEPAPMHIISWLPEEWATCFDDNGLVLGLRPGIIAGFERDGRFYTRDEAAALSSID